MRIAEHPEPVLPRFPHISHVARDTCPLTPFKECDPSWPITGAHVQPGCFVFPGTDNGLEARDESEEEYNNAEPQCAFRNGKPLARAGCRNREAKCVQCRPGSEKRLMP